MLRPEFEVDTAVGGEQALPSFRSAALMRS